MDPGTQIVMLLSVAGLALAVHVIARHRPGRFLLVRVRDAERHRAGTGRVLAVNALVALAATAAILFWPDPEVAPIIAVFAATLVPPAWMLVELRLALRGAVPAPVPSRFRVSLERPPGLGSYLSWPLALLDAAGLLLPPAALAIWNAGDLGPWFFFLPMMLFITALVLLSAWMQARERWVLPAEDGERYVELQHEKRARMVRMLQTGLACWNLAAGMIWLCVASGSAGPGYLGAAVAVVVGGPGFAIAMALQLPRLTRIADELAALARTDALGTRADGWRWGGLVYHASSDPALFVPKRNGLGQTLNLARPAAWLFLAGVLLVPPLITLLALAGASR